MVVNAVVPNVVLHFHGFRVSKLSNLEAALCHLALDMLRKMAVATAASSACLAVSQAAYMAVPVLADGLVSSLITFATFSSCTVLAHGPARLLHKQQLLASSSSTSLSYSSTDAAVTPKAGAAVALSPATLPLLSAKRLAPITCASGLAKTHTPKLQQPLRSTSAKTSSVKPTLPPIRRRLLQHLRQAPPNVNVVAGETRRRAQMSLLNANIRVGKAHTQLRTDGHKPVDLYIVRVDCTTNNSDASASSEKHMNPVIMWDVTATFDEFKKLEHALKREVKTKKLEGIKVPHLSSGAVLFVQEELTPHVLNARRARLQTFIDAIRTDAALAATDALRKFCQAY